MPVVQHLMGRGRRVSFGYIAILRPAWTTLDPPPPFFLRETNKTYSLDFVYWFGLCCWCVCFETWSYSSQSHLVGQAGLELVYLHHIFIRIKEWGERCRISGSNDTACIKYNCAVMVFHHHLWTAETSWECFQYPSTDALTIHVAS